MFVIGKIVGAVFLPPGLAIVLVALAVLLAAKGRRRAGLALAASAAVLLYLLSTRPLSDLLVAPLESRHPPLSGDVRGGAIVVLGGGAIQDSPEYGAAALSRPSTVRTAYGARLALASGLPLYYSGGAPWTRPGSESEASAAGRFLAGLGFPRDRIVLESASRDTEANASLVAALRPPSPVILVTSAIHMPRSMLAFRKAGLPAISAPTDYRRTSVPFSPMDFLPNSERFQSSCDALHEYLGLLYYSMK